METDLKQISDLDLIGNIKINNCSESLKELSSRHAALCFELYRRYSCVINSSGMSVEDLSQEKDYVVWQSAISYDPSKRTKFSTWLGNNVRFQCLNAINDSHPLITKDDKELNYVIEKNTERREEKNEILDYIFYILDQLDDKRIKKIFELRYINLGKKDKTSWNLIGRQLGLSTQTAINLHSKGKKILKEKLKSDTICDKI